MGGRTGCLTAGLRAVRRVELSIFAGGPRAGAGQQGRDLGAGSSWAPKRLAGCFSLGKLWVGTVLGQKDPTALKDNFKDRSAASELPAGPEEEKAA